MLSREDQNYVLSLVKQEHQYILDKIGFDPTLKEVGHIFGEKYEEAMANRLIEIDNRFALPVKIPGKGKQTRKMEDLTFKGHFVNIKFGHDKKGNPNMSTINRLIDRLMSDEYRDKKERGYPQIDSYWIISVDSNNHHICFFNLYEHLGFTNLNMGPQQLMLKEKVFYKQFDQEKDYTLPEREILLKLVEMRQIATEEHIQLRRKQDKSCKERVYAYLQIS
tara:strand:- start:169 stop:831 length:663 start_codon:yes stop_codon:yes gene_type:complete